MKKFFLLLFCSSFSFLFSQEIKKLETFNAISVFDRISVEIIPSTENKLVVFGNDAESVQIINKNGVLKIRMPFTKAASGEDINAKLYFKSIDNIIANEGSSVYCKEIIEITTLSVNAKEGADITLQLKTDFVEIRCVSGGIIDIKGTANKQDCSIGTGGNYKAKDLLTSETNVSISAGGNASIYATNLVNAKVKAGGTIFIYGKPKEINQEVFLGGTITEKE